MQNFISRPRPEAFFSFTALAVTLTGVLGAMVFAAQPARADIPVYLKPESRFPSGVHPKAWLEEKTTESDLQRWFRVVTEGPQKNYGWLAEDHVLTLLKLTSIARTTRPEPDRPAPQLDAFRTTRIEKGSQVIVLEVRGSWSRVRVLGEKSAARDSWMLNEALERDSGNQIQRAVTFRETPIRLEPRLDRKAHDHLPAFKEVAVLTNKASARNGDWVEIQLEKGAAWIERKNLWAPEDLRDGSIRAMQAGLELRSAPVPYADVVQTLTGAEKLKVIETKYVRWGKVKIPEHGWLWWPISDESKDETDLIPPLKMSTQDLVVRRIYDMALSPSVPGLRFASAKGVFKSRDGIEWSLISKFTDDNYPLAIAKNGLLFVGPYLSSDDGEKFEQWIRWDRLIETVKKGTGVPPAKLRLSHLKTIDDDGKTLHLTLDVGRSKPIHIGTTDRGISWKIL